MKKNGFTLIELLVVVAIITLLMALLFPSLQRARRQGRAVVCRSHLRQWGLRIAAYQSQNDGRYPQGSGPWSGPSQEPFEPTNWHSYNQPWVYQNRVFAGADSEDLILCPMAKRPTVKPANFGLQHPGETFTAWVEEVLPAKDRHKGLYSSGRASYAGSYAQNGRLCSNMAGHVRPALLPAMFDCGTTWCHFEDASHDAPPPCENWDLWKNWPDDMKQRYYRGRFMAIDRHQGAINMLFFDGAVRKVGLKELWALKWHEGFDNHGQWTTAGGVEPADWPQWMRNFPDH